MNDLEMGASLAGSADRVRRVPPMPRAGHALRRALAAVRACKQASLAPLWGLLALLAIATAWLLPNHAQPWLAFHSDAWMAAVLALIAGVVLAQTRALTFSALDLVLVALAAVPLLQYAAGFMPFAGQAWTSTAYVLGLALAVVVGRQWNAWRPDWMADILFGSFLAASLISVGLQLYQWTGLTADQALTDIWVYWLGGDRPYANLAQPNQLATLLLWGLLGCGWAVHRRHIGRSGALAAATMIIVGLALTQSRTGLLGLCAIVAAAWWWRGLGRGRTTAYCVSALLPLYLLASVAVGWGAERLLLAAPNSMLSRSVSEVRPALWAMFVDAAAQRPWFGYGWNESLTAHLAVTERHPGVPVPFGQAHNLVLDLVLWVGIPAGLALVAVLLAWFAFAIGRVRQPKQALYLLLLVTVGLHAMLEFPLYYAYFLLPAGLALGALSGDLRVWLLGPSTARAWRAALALLCASVLLLAAIVADYFRVEASTLDIRMKMAAFRALPKPPEVLVLTQFPAMVEFSLRDPALGASAAALQQARDVTALWATQQNLSKLILLLALNGHVPEARCWMVKSATLLGPGAGEFVRFSWSLFQRAYPSLEPVRWPAPGEAGALCDAVRSAPLGPWSQPRWAAGSS